MPNTDGKIVIGTTVDMGGMNTGLQKISKSWKQLQRLTGGAIGVIGLVNLGKAALNAASDLQEVQNIVDVAFGDMSGKMESFAQTSIEKFGMSELAAKQTGGSFMAMGKSMGLTMEQASDMAISLTALTGDMASFYNISQDYARVALSAVYTGETETLKRYGIVLTEANLQEYALSQGITTKVKAMDASSKAMLRYQYILKATQDMQGDFARTSGSWANQVRLLKEQWTVFLNVLGSGLITVLSPVLKMINAIISAITSLARLIGSALVNIFGLDVQSVSDTLGGVASSAGGAADGIDNVGDAATGAGNAAKKANKHMKELLGSYDELHVLSESASSGSGGSGGGGGGGGVADAFDIPQAESLIDKLKNKLESDIDSLYELGETISKTIADALASINWEKDVYPKAKEFGKGLAEFMNGLFTGDEGKRLFSELGGAIAGAVNTVFYAWDEWANEFNFDGLGEALSAGINRFLRDTKIEIAGDAFGKTVAGMATTLYQIVSKKSTWVLLGIKIAKGINAALKALSEVNEKTGLTGWQTIFADIALTLNGLGTALGEELKNIDWSLAIKGLADGIKTFLSTLSVDGLVAAIGLGLLTSTGRKIFMGLLNAIVSGITGATISEAGAALAGGTAGTVGAVVVVSVGFALVLYYLGSKFGWKDKIKSAATNIWKKFMNLIVDNEHITSWQGKTTLNIPLQARISEIKWKWDNFKRKLAKGFDDFWSKFDLGEIFSFDYTEKLIDDIVSKFEDAIDGDKSGDLLKVGEDIVAGILEGLAVPFAFILEPIYRFFDDCVQGFKDAFGISSPAKEMNFIGQYIIEGILEGFDLVDFATEMTTWWNANVAPWFTLEKWSGIADNIRGAIKGKWDELVTWWKRSGPSAWWDNHVAPWFKLDKWTTLANSIYKSIKGKWDELVTWWKQSGPAAWWDDHVAPWFKREKWDTLVQTIYDATIASWSDTVTQWKTDIADWWNNHVAPWFTRKKWDTLLGNIGPAFASAFKGAVNSAIDWLNGLLGKVEAVVGIIVDAINSISFEIPDLPGVPGAGSKVGFNLSKPNIGRIQKLANGAVIPPNREFMAILGDQRQGTNIEAPLSTIQEAVANVLEPYLAQIAANTERTANKDLTVQIGDRDIARANQRGQRVMGLQLRTS